MLFIGTFSSQSRFLGYSLRKGLSDQVGPPGPCARSVHTRARVRGLGGAGVSSPGAEPSLTGWPQSPCRPSPRPWQSRPPTAARPSAHDALSLHLTFPASRQKGRTSRGHNFSKACRTQKVASWEGEKPPHEMARRGGFYPFGQSRIHS